MLSGRCFEGEWAPPFGPFVEAIAGYAKDADPDALRADLGYGAPPVARLVPSLHERIPDIGEPVPLNPDEERFRLLDAVSQLVIATSARAPVVLVLDDLHWADGGTIAMLRHVARFLPGQRTLVLGAYRDVELDRQHPLADALASLRSEAEYERILVKGLDEGEVRARQAGAAVVLVRQLRRVFHHAVAVEPLHRLGDLPVQAHLPGWAQLGVEGVTDQGVREVVALGVAGRLHELRLERGVDRIERGRLVESGGVSGEADTERAVEA